MDPHAKIFLRFHWGLDYYSKYFHIYLLYVNYRQAFQISTQLLPIVTYKKRGPTNILRF